MNREFIETKEFTDCWNKLNLTDDDLRKLENELLVNPNAGVIMQETGGVRKMRFAFGRRGKSHCVRVVYIDFIIQEHIYLLTVFPKDKQDNLTGAQKNQMKKVTALITKAEEGNLMNNKNINEDYDESEFDEYTDYDESEFENFNMFESIMRGLNQALEYATTHYKSESVKLHIKETNE